MENGFWRSEFTNLCLTYDPNNTTTFYAGTGEIYTGGDAIGNGLWRSTDGGSSWENIFGGRSDSDEVFKSIINEIKHEV